MEYRDITISDKKRIIDGTVRVFTQEYKTNLGYIFACYHLNLGQKNRFRSEGIKVNTRNFINTTDMDPTELNINIKFKH